jgi:hypothetical protein
MSAVKGKGRASQLDLHELSQVPLMWALWIPAYGVFLDRYAKNTQDLRKEYRVDNVINWRGGAVTEEEVQWQKMTPDIMVLYITPDLDHVPLQKIVNRFV